MFSPKCLSYNWLCDHTEVLHAEKRMAWQSAANGQRADVTVGATEISSGGTTNSTFGPDPLSLEAATLWHIC